MSNEKENVKNVTHKIFIYCIIDLEIVENDHLPWKLLVELKNVGS